MKKPFNVSVKQLTITQLEVLQKLKSFVESEESFFRLEGYAGSGKSFNNCGYSNETRKTCFKMYLNTILLDYIARLFATLGLKQY